MKSRLWANCIVFLGYLFTCPGFAKEPSFLDNKVRSSRSCERFWESAILPVKWKSHGEVVEVSPGVKAYSDTQPIPLELQSLERFVERFGGDTLWIGNFKDTRGLPVVDAVWATPNARLGPLNISIKTSNNRERTNGMNFVHRSIDTARHSIQKAYNSSGFLRAVGLYREDDVPKPVYANRREKEQRFAEISEVLGFSNTSKRAIAVLMDMTEDTTQSPAIITAEVAFPDHPFESVKPFEVLLRVTDSRVAEREIDRPSMLNLTHLQRRIRAQREPIAAYIIMFAQSTLIVTAKGFKLVPYQPGVHPVAVN